jgi:hypothetical protein
MLMAFWFYLSLTFSHLVDLFIDRLVILLIVRNATVRGLDKKL